MRLDLDEFDRGSAIVSKAEKLGVTTKELERFFEEGHPKVPKMIADIKIKIQEAEKCQVQE